MSREALKALADSQGKEVDALVLETVRASSTLKEAADKLSVHPFTLRYRLERMGYAIGRDVKVKRTKKGQ